MATLKKIATQLIDALDRPFDEMFLRRVMDLIINERASLIRQEINKGDSAHYYTFPYEVELEMVNGLTENIIYGQSILRSVNKIPTPVRISSPEPFYQVMGTGGGPTLTFVAGATEYKFRKNLDKIGGAIVYMWRNNRIYILNNLKLEKVIALAAYESPYVYVEGYDYNEVASGNVIVCDEDMEFPMPIDLIANIKAKLLTGELSIIDDKDKIVPAHVDNN